VSDADGLDRAAFKALFRRLERPVYNVVYRWLWDPAEAADVVQDAFSRLWGMRDRVRAGTVEPLVYRIAVNLASNRRRRRRLWRWVGLKPERDAAPPAGDPLEAAELDGALRGAVEALPEKLRRVVMLCELSGMSYGPGGGRPGDPGRHGRLASQRRPRPAARAARRGGDRCGLTPRCSGTSRHRPAASSACTPVWTPTTRAAAACAGVSRWEGRSRGPRPRSC
jgi:RNA polymerase sigma factor, sigma-70 family